MNGIISLVVVDDNSDFVDLVRSSLESEADIRVVGTAYNGNEALICIQNLMPDVVLLDVVMPEKDGLEVLEEIRNSSMVPKPIIIMLTAIGQDNYIRRALALGAEYYIIKPFDLNLLAKRIRQIHEDVLTPPEKPVVLTRVGRSNGTPTLSQEEVETEVEKALRDVSVPPHLTGYLFLKQAIVATILSEKGFIPATKELYPSIADEFNTSPGKIERAIRGAIQKAWGRKEQTNASLYFAYAGKYKNIKPTNSEFIATIAGKIRQKLRIDV